MKNSRNTRHSQGKNTNDSFMFPDRDDTYFELPDDDGYDSSIDSGSYDDEYDDGYDTFQDDYDYEDEPKIPQRGGRPGTGSGRGAKAPLRRSVDGGRYGESGEQRMYKKASRDQEKQIRKEEAKRPKGVKNREILVVMYAFIFLFVAVIGYFVYYNALGSKSVINHPGNVHIAKLQEKTTRGRILAADGSVLAQTVVDTSGNETREYPYANVFAHVVGTSEINKSGLEASNEGDLLMSNINPLTQALNELKNEKNPGDDVVTTLDTQLQQVAYNALGNNDGVVVAIEPSTGKVLAMVSKPDYDPNTLEENYSYIISQEENKSLLNQATQGLFTPGSIFKILTTLEYMKEDSGYNNYTYTCQGSILLSDGASGQQGLSCYQGTVHGTQDLLHSFSNSCNASFANIGTQLNAASFTQLANTMLFNRSLPTEISHVKSSFQLSDSDSDWLKGATAIGQGYTTMTPLHAAMITSAIANGGVLMEPYLVDRIQSNDGNTVSKNMPESYGNLMTASEASILTDMMIETVNSGTAASLSGMGYTIAGKTGTAEVENSGNNAWFVGFAPAENPQIAVCVLVENASTSSSYIAVPIAKQLFQAYVN